LAEGVRAGERHEVNGVKALGVEALEEVLELGRRRRHVWNTSPKTETRQSRRPEACPR
jgi:hypothetical protein